MDQIIYAGKHLLTYSVAKHFHASWEFIYCTGGNGRLGFDSFVLPYTDGDIVIIPPYVSHINTSEEGFTNIHLNMLDPNFTVKKPTLFHDDENRMIRAAFTGSFLQFSAERGRQTPLLAAYGHLIVCHLSKLLETPVYGEIVEEIVSAILNNYPNSDFALNEYLRGLPFSYDYIRKLFKKEVGVTPHRYLNDLRMQVAAQYLANSRLGSRNVAEISRLCGFHEPLYFSRMFKKKYGVSPSAYSDAAENQETLDSENIKIML